MSNMKKYLMTSVVLGSIATASGLLIAGTNLITRDRIKANEQETINMGLAKIYDIDDVKNLNSSMAELPEEQKFDYVLSSYYEVKNANNEPLGYAFKTKGSNSYGSISLIVGFNANYIYQGVSVVENGQSFASTLQKNYLNPLIKEHKSLNEVDVSCGATFGAKLTRDMINDAYKAAEYLKGANNG